MPLNHRVTSVVGHVFSVDFGKEYASWDSVDPAELFDAPIVKKPTKKGRFEAPAASRSKGHPLPRIVDGLRSRGENINFECLDVIGWNTDAHMPKVFRAKFSAINEKDIVHAYGTLIRPDENESLAVDARQELDLKVGVAFSRFQTRFFQGRYGDLDASVISYGPCQTPTLGFCVQRHLDILHFVPKPYWTLDLTVTKNGIACKCAAGHGRYFKMGNAKNVLSLVEASRDACVRVKSVVSKEKKQGRPAPLNTVGFLKACSKGLCIGPHAAMQLAERLYLMGYVSYPRTESTAYPSSFDIVGTLKMQTNDRRWGSYCINLIAKGPTRAKRGVDHGDHPPITPCRGLDGYHDLSGDMIRVYELITRHFIATVSPDAVWLSTRVDFAIEGVSSASGKVHEFSIRGKKMLKPGFLEALQIREYLKEDEYDENGYAKEEEEEEVRSLPAFVENERIPLRSASAPVKGDLPGTRAKIAVSTQKQTSPPSHLSESELISIMERKGIGTDASIPSHIENIQKRNYATLGQGRRMVPTQLGLVLAQGYQNRRNACAA